MMPTVLIMRQTALSFFVIIFLCSTSLQSQSSQIIDSLIKVTEQMQDDSLKVANYGTLYEKLMFSDPELSFEYAQLENKLAKKIDYKKGIAAGNLHIADFYKNRGEIDSARFYFKNAREKFIEMKSLKGELFINHSMASFEQSLGNFDKALEYGHRNIEIYDKRDTINNNIEQFNLIGSEYELIGSIHLEKGNYKIALEETLKAVRFFEQIEDILRKGDALKQLGTIEYLLGNFEVSLSYGLQAFKIYKDNKDYQYMAYTANDIGNNYQALSDFNGALTYFRESLEIAQTNKIKEIEGDALVNIGSVYMAQKKESEARQFLKEGLTIYQELGYKNKIVSGLNELAKLETELNNPKLAIEYVDRSIVLSKEIGALNNLSFAYAIRSKAYEKANSLGMALQDFKQYKIFNDSIFNTTKSRQIEELRTLYETEKKEQEIAIQQGEIEVLEQKAKVSNLQRMFLGTGLGLSLLVFGLGFYGLRQKMKRNKLEKEKVDAELAFKKKELTTHALHLAKKNEVLESLKQKAEALKKSENSQNGYQQLIRTINFDLQDDNNWENFSNYFEQVHKDFNSNVKQKFPEVTPNELRLMALLKMNLSSKEIANILNISQEGIKKARYRLRKKLNITTEESLQDIVLSL